MELDETNNLNSSSKRLRNTTMAICNGSVSKLEENQELDEESRKRIMPWSAHPASRIYRVSRASGGKDRHSKVYTAKGIRDRRVRLSVSTAIQFYDLQDRLGYDQPSKAIEWLIKAASNAIDKLPSLDHSFGTETLMQGNSNNKLARVGSDEPDLDQTGFNNNNNNQLTKSTCSSTSETSKGSVLSLSRSENRVKARERARERTKDKEKGQDETPPAHQVPGGGASFTELLTGPSNSVHLPTPAVLTTADYFKINQNHHNHNHHNHHNHNHNNNHSSNGQMQHLFSPQVYGNFAQMINFPSNHAGSPAGDHAELHQYSFLQENNLIPVAQLAPAGDNYNLNFSISSNNNNNSSNNNNNLVGVNSRGTLQSNSASQIVMPRLVSSQLDGSSLNLPFFFGSGAPAGGQNGATSAAENQYIQFWDGYRQQHHGSDLKEKGKN